MNKNSVYLRAIVAYVSVLAILAVSVCSLFLGVDFNVKATLDATVDEWDGTYDLKFIVDNQGDGTSQNPYIISTAEQLAAVCARGIQDASGNIIDTTSLYFKVADGIKAFYMNGSTAVAQMTSAAQVKDYFLTNTANKWDNRAIFKGVFDGNGVTVFGLYTGSTQAGNYLDFAALFPQTGKGAVIKNIALENSYIEAKTFTGGIVAKGYDSEEKDVLGLTLENVAVINNVIVCNSGDCAFGGIVYAYTQNYAVNVNNCLAYGNVGSYPKTPTQEMPLFSYSNASVVRCAFNNIVSIGQSLNGMSWWTKAVDNGMFTNVFSDRIDENQNFNNNTSKTFNLLALEPEDMVGKTAKEKMNLDETIWFYNTTTYPQIRAFHTIVAQAQGVDGHTNEKTTCCDLLGLGDGVVPHSYNSNNECVVCKYEYPCVEGHKFTDVPSVEASEKAPGNIAYKHCEQCLKNYSTDAAVNAPVDSALTDKEIIIPQMLPYDEWDGTYDYFFWMNNTGDGSVTNPFIISTAEQLAAVAVANLKYNEGKATSDNFDINKYTIENNVLNTNGLCFKVKDGITAFYMNGGEELAKMNSVDEVKEYFASNSAYEWNPVNIFRGSFNGNGATVYGLYSKDERFVGLFPKIGLVTIKNVIVKNSYFVTAEGNHNEISIGGIAGLGEWYSDPTKYGTVTIKSCTVANNYICSQNTDKDYGRAGAIVGNLYENALALSDCLVYGNEIKNGANIPSEYPGGIIGYAASGDTLISDVVSIGATPYVTAGNYPLRSDDTFVNVYTDCATTVSDGAPIDFTTIVKLTVEQMTGAAAADNMPALNWGSAWQTNDGGYPTPRIKNVKEYAAGCAWTGEIAQEFPAGDGSKNNPYKIATAEYLALMLNSENAGVYYELTENIIINDTSSNNWKENAKIWYTSNDVAVFEGNLEGNGHTVYGLYYNDVAIGASAGLIPLKGSGDVKNIKFANSYLSGSANASIGAVIGSVVDASTKPITVQGVAVDSTVVIEGNATLGGVIGSAGTSVVRISNSISKANINTTGMSGAFVGSASEGVSVKNAIAVDMAPIGGVNSATLKNVYTNVNTSIDGVIVLDTSAMKGELAASNMPGLDFDQIWTIIPDDYPALSGVIKSENGVQGEIWSGGIASDYAGGDGTVENPYLIATGEQLARCVVNHGYGKHYKLIADIYLNDVDSAYWNAKIGCNEWYHSKNGSGWNLFQKGSFDGDGHVIYGLYFGRSDITDKSQSAFVGLFATIGSESLIQNVALSNAYVAGSIYNKDGFNDFSGALVGLIPDWDDVDLPAWAESKDITNQPEYFSKMPTIKNCLVDHNSYISGTYAGGILGGAQGSVRIHDSIFTGTIKASNDQYAGGIVGNDFSYGGHFYNCVSLPQSCDRPYGGSSNADWRAEEHSWCTTVEGSYYFSKYNRMNAGTKIARPTSRVGEAAVVAMPLLDWENNWAAIKDGTPVQKIFAQHRSQEELELLSDKTFSPPDTKVFFVTNVSGFEIAPISGKMYSPLELPEISRDGYKFMGWHVFSDGSLEYPYDYFLPRDLTLFAIWEPAGVVQDFEDYANSIWDCDSNRWTYNKPGAKGGYKVDYIYDGFKSMHLLDTADTKADCLINYEDMLTVGQKYKMTFWVTTDKLNNPDTALSLVHNKYPDYERANSGCEDMVTITELEVGNWKQYEYEFTAKTPWVSIRAGGNSSLYFDGVIITPVGNIENQDKLVEFLSAIDVNAGTIEVNTDVSADVNTDENTISPDTSESVTIAVVISVILSCAIIAIISRKNLVEVIEG